MEEKKKFTRKKRPKRKEKIKVFSICTGAGGMDTPFIKDPRFQVVGFSEVNKYANSILKYKHPRIFNYGDINETAIEKLPAHSILIGGTPCQDLSIAGKRSGIAGERSGLFYKFVEILEKKRPRNFIWENVKGSLNSSQGWDFAEIQDTLADAGYDVRWEVLNARDYGVPQIRERVFIIGCLRGDSAGEVFLRKKGIKEDIRCDVETKEPPRIYDDENFKDYGHTDTYWETRKKSLAAYSKSTRDAHIDHRIKLNKEANTLNTGEGCVSMSTGNYVYNGKIRRLTPLECERLMGWSDNHTATGMDEKNKLQEISDTQRYKICGNGVVPQCVEAIVKELFKETV